MDSFPASEAASALKTMHEHFLGASELIICSGDFDWIASDEDLRGLLEGLAGQDKLRLFTYKGKEKVRELWENNGDGELFKKFEEHLTNVPSGVPKFSLIKHGSEVTFLSYVAMPANREIGATNISVCSLKGPEARNLVTNIDELLQSLITNVGHS